MNDDEKNEFARALRKAASQATFRVDEQLANLRRIYDQLPEDNKKALRDWVAMVADTKRAMPDIFAVTSLRLKISEQTGQDEDGIGAEVPILLLPEALNHWDRGEVYVPKPVQALRGS